MTNYIIFLLCFFMLNWYNSYAQQKGKNNIYEADHFVTFYPEHNKSPHFDVRAKIWRSNDTLKVQVKASFNSSSPPIAQAVNRDGGYNNDDYIYVAVAPHGPWGSGYLFGVNKINTQQDRKISNLDQANRSWNYNWESKTNVGDSLWTASFSIPLNGLINNPVDSLGINILRGIIKTPNGYEAASMTSVRKGSPSTSLINTTPIPFSYRGTPSVNGYVLPYFRGNYLDNNNEFDKYVGFEGKVTRSKNTIYFTYHPDFSFVSPASYELDILSNSFYASENRDFFTNSQQYTNLPVSTLYSRRFGNGMSWGGNYSYDGNNTDLFFMSLRSPIVNDVVSGQESDRNYWFSQLAGTHSMDDVEIQANISQLSDGVNFESPSHHYDLNFIYNPGLQIIGQFSYDAKNSAPILYGAISSSNQVGFSYNGGAQYISPNYSYPLAYLRFGNNNWSTFGDLSYTWTRKTSFLPSISLGGGWLTLTEAASPTSLIQEGHTSLELEVLPLTFLSYSFSYDRRPNQNATNIYHSISANTQLSFSTIGLYWQTGSSFGEKLTYWSGDLTASPTPYIYTSASFTYQKQGTIENRIYTVSTTINPLTDFYFRCYYQRIQVPGRQVNTDNLNFLLAYYLGSKRNRIYIATNLTDNLNQFNSLFRVGYEIAF